MKYPPVPVMCMDPELMWQWDPWFLVDTPAPAGMVREPKRPRFPRWAGFHPPVNIYESPNAFLLQFKLPGVLPENMDLTVDENQTVILTGVRPREEIKGTYHHWERPHGRFVRRVRLPVALNGDKVQALYRDGILSVNLAKVPEAHSRRIKVTAD